MLNNIEPMVAEEAIEFIHNVVEAVDGNQSAYLALGGTFIKRALSVREQLFWKKLQKFILGAYLNDELRGKLSAKLAQRGDSNEQVLELVGCIERAENMEKVQYLSNATRCYLSDFISGSEFFRICHIINNAFSEDLRFLRDNILKGGELPLNERTIGLFAVGLMYYSTIGDPIMVSFTELASKVDRFAVSYRDIERYPDPTKEVQNNAIFRATVKGLPEVIEKEELVEVLLGNI